MKINMNTTVGFPDDEDEVHLEPLIQDWEDYLDSQEDDGWDDYDR
jgi:hypothetical protein